MIRDPALIPERKEGEPARATESPSKTAGVLVRQTLGLLFALALAPLIWLPYLPLRLIYGRAPVVPSARQVGRYLRRSWTDDAPPPGISFTLRLRLSLEVLRIALLAPLSGLAWYLDEILYGRELDQTTLSQPIFELSAARSGSTQLARYVEQDPHVVAPSFVQALFPYLWLWKIAPGTVGRLLTREKVEKLNAEFVGPIFLERHEADPFSSDTFDIVFYAHHLNGLGRLLGPALMREECTFADVYEPNPSLWDHDFVDFVDRLGRKAMRYAGPSPDGQPRRLLIKGHFIAAADALERRFPDARFLVMVRPPLPRIQSVVNFLAVAPELLGTGHAPWSWLVEVWVPSEVRYCEQEMAWAQRPGGHRCVIDFQHYVRDLEGTMRRVYAECLGQDELPAHAPRQHAPRVRTNYSIDRSLAELGIDEAALGARLAAYEAWRASLP